MSLTNSQYDKIMAGYAKTRDNNDKILAARQREIKLLSPEYAALAEKLIDLSASAAELSLQKPGFSIDEYKKESDAIIKRQKEILIKLGKSGNYLDPVYTCPICHDTGIINGKKCSCFNKKAVDLIYKESNLRNMSGDISFDTFDESLYPLAMPGSDTAKSPRKYALDALRTAKEFVDDFEKGSDNLLIYGNTGLGKTFLCTCIAKELINTTHSVVYLTAVNLFERLEQYDENSPILNCDLLIIDDLGTELPNSFTTSKLFYCLNERLLRRKSTVISTNLDLKKLPEVYTERIFSRILESYKIIKLTGDDIRRKKYY